MPCGWNAKPSAVAGWKCCAAARAQLGVARAHAAQRAQEDERALDRVGAVQVGAARGERADQDLRARVGGLHRRVGGAHQRAVEVRRDRRAGLARAGRLRAQPAAEVRLVPEDVAVDARPVALGHRGREVRVVAPDRARSAGRRGPGPGSTTAGRDR